MTIEEQATGVFCRWRGIPGHGSAPPRTTSSPSTSPHQATAQIPNDVPFNAKGYELLGGQVAQSILRSLKKVSP